MKIISVDLPWKTDKKGRRTLAIASLDGSGRIVQASDDDGLLELVCNSAEAESIILLDIPIDGWDGLGSGHLRPIDKAIAHQALPALPASKAKGRGKTLKELLEGGKRGLKVYEIYPYAIYKVLAYLRCQKLLRHLSLDRFDALLDDGFLAYWPPKYKREKRRQRLENMQYLYYLLKDTMKGLNLEISIHYPNASSNLDQLGDEYDACLGAIVGLYFARKSGYACIAGDSDSGNMLLLADRWLSERLGWEVPVYQPGKGIKL